MDVRISRARDDRGTTIYVEGQLTEAQVPDLWVEYHESDMLRCLDLSGLVSADQEGVCALRLLSAEGVELFGASPYIRELLRETP